MPVSTAGRGERIVRRRAIAAIVLGSALIATQGRRMHGGGGTADWAIWGVVLVAFVLWGSGLLAPRGVRAIVADEMTARICARSMAIGFGTMVAAGATCHALTYLRDYGARDAVGIILSTGLSSVLIAFGVAEMGSRARP